VLQETARGKSGNLEITMESITYTKQCTVCKETFPATTDYFYAAPRGKYGVLAICKTCHSNKTKALDKTLKVYNGEMKTCTHCRLEFPATTENFYKKKSGQYGISEICIRCDRKRQAVTDNTLKVYNGEKKVCSNCQQELSATTQYFVPSKRGKYGLAAECKTCLTQKHQQLMREDPEYAARRRATGRRYKSRNMDKARQWQLDNPEKQRESERKYRQNNPDKVRAATRKWEHEHPEMRAIYKAARAAKKQGAGGKYTVEDLVDLYELQTGCCCWCGREMVNRLVYKNAPRKVKFTVDHIKAIHNGGSSYPHNLVLACASCNSTKNKREVFTEWQPPNMLDWMLSYVQHALEIENEQHFHDTNETHT
jgi:5-methylcytosine-specific restriction endonuclease McrA